MKREEIFHSASWIGREGDFHILRRTFVLPEDVKIKRVTICAVGLGYCRIHYNGVDLAPYSFLPLSTDYEKRANYPAGEELTGHRLYVPRFDVTGLSHGGKNLLTIFFGGGWYCLWGKKFQDSMTAGDDKQMRFGDAKAIYCVLVETEDGIFEFSSSSNDKICDGGIYDYRSTRFECRDLNAFSEEALTNPEFDDSAWENAINMPDVETDYLFSDCPIDTLIEKLPVVKGTAEVYDCGINTTGYPVLNLSGKPGDKVIVRMSEGILEDGALDPYHMHRQMYEVICDGKRKEIHPEFIWYGFRYFTVEGPAEPAYVAVVHSNVGIGSDFKSDNEVLNFLYRTYVNTQLANMHGGIPSDCPHLERCGYTGDGELTCHAAMTTLNAKEFYKKWIEDISDCQDKLSGHIQYTAPYIRSGGGPGAWGCAIVEVPWQYYRHYGDAEPMLRLYPQMKEYFRFMEEHSIHGLVVSDAPGNWCLGDWCAPDKMIILPQYVNNYYYIKALKRAVEIAKLQGFDEDVALFEGRIAERQEAIMAAYYNIKDNNFCGNVQGANAFAIDAGLGTQKTYDMMVNYYQDTCEFDTGICGTDVLIRVLFEHGDADLAVKLLSSDKPNSFGGMLKKGATTLWEYWPADHRGSRSLNHPMFGAVTAYLFEYVLGIRQNEGSAGYKDLIIEPYILSGHTAGSQLLPDGKISVDYVKRDDGIDVSIEVPESVKAVFSYKGCTRSLNAGMNCFSI